MTEERGDGHLHEGCPCERFGGAVVTEGAVAAARNRLYQRCDAILGLERYYHSQVALIP